MEARVRTVELGPGLFRGQPGAGFRDAYGDNVEARGVGGVDEVLCRNNRNFVLNGASAKDEG
jgi:hypothetical protein